MEMIFRITLGGVVYRFKSLTTAGYRQGVKNEDWPPVTGRLWQRNYYEHIVRGEKSMNQIGEYINH